jgi:hypothetical protein
MVMKLTHYIFLITVFFQITLSQNSGNVLVEIEPCTNQVLTLLEQKNIPVYHIFDKGIIAEISLSEMYSLEKSQINYQVIDEKPWSERYFIVNVRGNISPKVAINNYKIIISNQNSCLIKSNNVDYNYFKELRYAVIEMKKIPIRLNSYQKSRFINYFNHPRN